MRNALSIGEGRWGVFIERPMSATLAGRGAGGAGVAAAAATGAPSGALTSAIHAAPPYLPARVCPPCRAAQRNVQSARIEGDRCDAPSAVVGPWSVLFGGDAYAQGLVAALRWLLGGRTRRRRGADLGAAALATAAETAPAVNVERFVFTGQTLLDSGQLDAAVAAFKGRRTLEELRRAAEAVQRLYAEAGYAGVVAYVPPQTGSDGTITIAVVEGRIARITVPGASAERAAAAARQPAGPDRGPDAAGAPHRRPDRDRQREPGAPAAIAAQARRQAG